MNETEREIRRHQGDPGRADHHHYYYQGWGWCWPAGPLWCGACIVAIGAGLILSDLETFRDSEATVWGIVLGAFGLIMLAWGLRNDSGRRADR